MRLAIREERERTTARERGEEREAIARSSDAFARMCRARRVHQQHTLIAVYTFRGILPKTRCIKASDDEAVRLFSVTCDDRRSFVRSFVAHSTEPTDYTHYARVRQTDDGRGGLFGWLASALNADLDNERVMKMSDYAAEMERGQRRATTKRKINKLNVRHANARPSGWRSAAARTWNWKRFSQSSVKI